jgi:hypothetical protein
MSTEIKFHEYEKNTTKYFQKAFSLSRFYSPRPLVEALNSLPTFIFRAGPMLKRRAGLENESGQSVYSICYIIQPSDRKCDFVEIFREKMKKSSQNHEFFLNISFLIF